MPRAPTICLALAVASLDAATPARAQPAPTPSASREPTSLQPQRRPAAPPFHLLSTKEATVADIRAALEAGAVTCRQLVQGYIDRIEAYDRRGPTLNAIVTVNPGALAAADALDARFAQSGLVGPMHCVPVIVKDNFETVDMPTTAGSLSLKDSAPPRDAFMVASK